MITVDVFVPALEKIYDFSVDETVQISLLIEELTETICQRERWEKPRNVGDLVLCDMTSGNLLPGNEDLARMGVRAGSRLMLC